MDIFLIILGVLCLLAGLAGCFLPVLPGPPVSYVGLLLLHFTDKIHFSTTHLILWAFLVIIVQVMDYVTPMLGTKYSGGGKWGNRGCMIGTIRRSFRLSTLGCVDRSVCRSRNWRVVWREEVCRGF